MNLQEIQSHPELLTPETMPAAVHAVLTEYMDSRAADVAAIGSPVVEAVEYLRSFVLDGGKRVRPMYGWAGFVGAGGLDGDEDPLAVLRAVSSLEFIQACALIHDDIIDVSDTRRGNPTVYRAVEKHHDAAGWLGDSEHFGISAAILIGDLALVWAEDMLHDAGLSPEAYSRAWAPWRAMRTEVIGGQLLDISLEAAGSENVALANAVNRFKTAAYTIERPLHIGAAIAGASEETIDAFRGYGHDIGIAYQLRDDQLGVFGDPSVTGKPAGDDLREGKRTELLATALPLIEASAPEDAKLLRSHVGQTQDAETIARMTAIIEASGAVEKIEERIDALFTSGVAHLERGGIKPEVIASLSKLAHAATQRRA